MKNLLYIVSMFVFAGWIFINIQTHSHAQDKATPTPSNPPKTEQQKPKNQQQKPQAKKPQTQKQTRPIIHEGAMTVDKMDVIIKRLDANAKNIRKGSWTLTVEKTNVIIITDGTNNRMRILVPIRKVEGLSSQELIRMMQANFDTALDSRYAIANKILWATFIHSLSTLHERQFISAIGQTVNAALTYGTTYSSGELSYGGGDSQGIIRRQLIDKLLEKGLPI